MILRWEGGSRWIPWRRSIYLSVRMCMWEIILLILPIRMEWFWGTDSTRQFDPNVTSQNQLGKGQRYICATDAVRDKKGVVIEDYRKDGSIIFTNETSAYNRMWSQANDHYNKEKEVGGFILENGTVLVVPDYNTEKNDRTPSKYGDFVSKDGDVALDEE